MTVVIHKIWSAIMVNILDSRKIITTKLGIFLYLRICTSIL